MQAHTTAGGTGSPSGPRGPSPDDLVARDAENFSLVLGGPLYQLLRRAHLSDDALQMVRMRLIVIALVTWLPLLVLAALEGHLWAGGLTVPFLSDVEVHIRLLAVVPLMIFAELVVHQRLRAVGLGFLERKLIPEPLLMRFDAALRSAYGLRNSVLAEVLLIAAVYGIGILVVWRHYSALDTATWYATPSASGTRLSLAGMWYCAVSLPFFQFLLIRWYFRLFVWTRFLWQVSRIELSIVPAHPDRFGGLGFLSNTVYAFAVLLVAHGAMLAAQLASRIFFLGASFVDYKVEIGVMVAFLLCVVFGPLLVFAPQLARAKRTGLREYGTLAGCYVREFEAKWLHGGLPAGELLLGSPDVQSLADMNNSFEVVRGMRIALVTKDALIQLGAAVLVPMAPLALTMMPVEELAKRLFGLLF